MIRAFSARLANQKVFGQGAGFERLRKPIRSRATSGPSVASHLVDILRNHHGLRSTWAAFTSGAENHFFSELVSLDQHIDFGNDGRQLKLPHSLSLCLQPCYLSFQFGVGSIHRCELVPLLASPESSQRDLRTSPCAANTHALLTVPSLTSSHFSSSRISMLCPKIILIISGLNRSVQTCFYRRLPWIKFPLRREDDL